MSLIASLAGGIGTILSSITSAASSSSSSATKDYSSVAASVRPQSKHEKLMADALRDQGYDDDTIAQIQSDIRDAIAEERVNGGLSSETIKSTIKNILQQYGVNTTRYETYIAAHQQHHATSGTTTAQSTTTNTTSSALDCYA